VFSRFLLGVQPCSALLYVLCRTTRRAENQVSGFHQSLDAGDFDLLYDGGSDDLKKAATKKDFVAILEAGHRKLGKVSSATKTSWSVKYNTGESFVTLIYDTTFEQGKGVEKFIYHLADNKPLLAGYYIDSNELISWWRAGCRAQYGAS
jgi:hypothetical protein